MRVHSRTQAIYRHLRDAPASARATSAAASSQQTIALNSGHLMPILGLGTFQATAPGEVKAAVKVAVNAGYRLIDCAAGYGNQAEVGDAIAELIAEGVVKREELFVVSKLFQTHHDWEGDGSRCQATLEQSLEELQLDYVDLYLMHWPFAFKQLKLEQPLGTPQPLRMADGSPNPIWTIKMEYLQTWAVMESMVAAGKVKAIGVSNFTEEQLTHLIGNAKIVPAVNQIELHPYLGQVCKSLPCEVCKSALVVVTISNVAAAACACRTKYYIRSLPDGNAGILRKRRHPRDGIFPSWFQCRPQPFAAWNHLAETSHRGEGCRRNWPLCRPGTHPLVTSTWRNFDSKE